MDRVPGRLVQPPDTERAATTTGKMFQLAPKVDKCNPFVPNSPYPTGILVGLEDRSVRFLSGTVSESTFWSAVTPAGGEVLGSDW